MRLLDILATLLLVRIVEGAWIPFWRRASKCNGREELCERSYSNVTVVGAHNSFAWSDISIILSRNQEVNVTQQLDLGVRLLQAQSHIDVFGEFRLCHTNCFLFDGGKVLDFLRTVKSFLDRNTQEIVTLIFTNPEGISVPDVWVRTFEASGLVPMIYVPPHLPLKYTEWPTLGEMIDDGRRLVVFMDSKTNTSVVPWIMPQFQMIWEDPFTVTNASFPCSVSQIHGPLPVEDHTYLINHSLHKKAFSPIIDDVYIPDRGNLSTTNSLPSIVDHSHRCSPLGAGRNPQFLLMDFVHMGDAFKAADLLNGLPPIPDPNAPKGSAVSTQPMQIRLQTFVSSLFTAIFVFGI